MDGGLHNIARRGRVPAPALLLRGAAGLRDDRVRAAAFVFRLAAAVAIVGLSPLVDGVTNDERAVFAWATALGWLPAVSIVDAIRRRRDGALVDVLNLGLDLAFLLFTLVVFDTVIVFVLSAQLLVVGYSTYIGGSRLGLLAGAASVGVALGADRIVEARVETVVVALYLVVVTGMVLLMRGLAVHHVAAAADIAHLHDKATAIATGVAEAVVVTSPRGRIRETNSAAEVSLGCPSDGAVGRGCAEVLGLRRELEELDCSDGCALLRARLEEEDSTGDVKVWRRRSPGSDERQALLAQVAPLTDESGRIVEVVHSFRDVSRLVEADEAKTLFLATATHELKTPLTVIMGFSELLSRRSDLPDAERDHALQAIQDRTRQLSDIVDRVLLSSRIEAGGVEVDRAPLEISGLVEERARSTITAFGRSPALQLPAELPLALADEDALATVLDHLLDNAVKYSGSETTVTVTAGFDDDSVFVSITDRGIGMSPEDIEHCTERFWQAEGGDVRRYGGTGIGLYIVKSLVDAMRGDLEITSEPGSGTTFMVRLCRADAGAVAPDPGETDRSIIREFMRQVGVAEGRA